MIPESQLSLSRGCLFGSELSYCLAVIFGGKGLVSPWPQVGDWKHVEDLEVDFELFLQEHC